MSWQDRVRTSIKLTSPSGLVFMPGWKGDDMSFEKTVAQFHYPTINGTEVQDLGRGGFLYPLTLYFEGEDNDTESLRFMRALGETGTWTVVHPVDGTLTLQPIGTPKRPVRPLESGNLTVVSTEWIVPLEAEATSAASASETAAAVESAVSDLDDATEATAVAATSQSIASRVAATVTAVKRNIATLKKALVSTTARVNAIISTITELLTEMTVDMVQVSGAVTELLATPGLFSGSIKSQLASLVRVGKTFIDNLPTALSFTVGDRNQAVVGELFLSSTISAMATVITSDLPETRSEALALLSQFNAFSDSVSAALDDMASRTADANLEDQFFGGSATTDAIAKLRALVTRYLLSIICDLKVERRIVLDRGRATYEIAVTEYGATADTADDCYSLLCRSNHLHGLQVLWLPAGTELVIYEGA